MLGKDKNESIKIRLSSVNGILSSLSDGTVLFASMYFIKI